MCAIVTVSVMAYDRGDPILGDMNGDQRVDILDLQIIVGQALHGTAGQANPTNGMSVLDFQRTVAEAGHPMRSAALPPAKTLCKICYFRFQSGWIFEPCECRDARELADAETTEPHRFDRPDKCISPPTTERYLFRLTSNAPPVSA